MHFTHQFYVLYVYCSESFVLEPVELLSQETFLSGVCQSTWLITSKTTFWRMIIFSAWRILTNLRRIRTVICKAKSKSWSWRNRVPQLSMLIITMHSCGFCGIMLTWVSVVVSIITYENQFTIISESCEMWLWWYWCFVNE